MLASSEISIFKLVYKAEETGFSVAFSDTRCQVCHVGPTPSSQDQNVHFELSLVCVFTLFDLMPIAILASILLFTAYA